MHPLPPIPWLDVAVLLALIGLNGLFALSELAIVSARPAKLKTMAKAGKRGAQTALDLAEEPGRFLSTVQIGITLIGILAGAFSGSRLGTPVAARLPRRSFTSSSPKPRARAFWRNPSARSFPAWCASPIGPRARS